MPVLVDDNEILISIHALREEGDRPGLPNSGSCERISIHALREEGDWWRG